MFILHYMDPPRYVLPRPFSVTLGVKREGSVSDVTRVDHSLELLSRIRAKYGLEITSKFPLTR